MPAPATVVDARVVAQVYVKVDGAAAPDGFLEDMTGVLVENSLHLPDMATIELHNPELRWTEGAFKFEIGKTLVIEMGQRDHKRELFSGEITGVEVEASSEVTKARVTAYDRAHRLHRGRKTRTFLNVTDSDIASKIAGEVGLSASGVAATTVRHDWVLQNNQTNMEFLQERAARIGYQIIASEGKLLFKPAPAIDAEPVNLDWATGLFSFRGRMSAGEQIKKVEVRGWDPKTKKEFVGVATKAEPQWANGISKDGAAMASTFGETVFAVTRQPVRSIAEAKKMAQAVLDDLGNMFMHAEGSAVGDPKIRLGSKVNITGVGAQFSGKYTITEARHVFEQAGYKIEFKATGHRSTDVLSVITPSAPPPVHVMIGIVTNVQDDDDKGRVKVKFPWLADNLESHWCRVVSTGGGNQRGIQFMPEVDDEVLVIGAHMDDLYIVGGLWNGIDKPPLGKSEFFKGGKVVKRVIRSRTGHIISIDDSPDGGNISIIDSGGKNKVIIDTKTNCIEMEAQKDITIKAGGNLTLESKTGATKITAGTDFKAESQLSANIETMGSLALAGKGPSSTASLKGTLATEVKGLQVSIGQ